jgi:small subunit ribosomal protein S8
VVVYIVYTDSLVCVDFACAKLYTEERFRGLKKHLGNYMDTLSNFLTAIRNAEMAGHASVQFPLSKMVVAVGNVLSANGIVKQFQAGETTCTAGLIPGVRHHIKRLSKPGRRLYTSAQNIPTVRNGRGMVILSTPKGVLSSKDARKQGVGGELLCEVF